MEVIILSGTCASGKTSLAKYIAKVSGYVHLDGDNIRRQLKKIRGLKKLDWNSIHPEIILLAETLLSTQKKVVISHLILPKEFELYRRRFDAMRVSYLFRVLTAKRAELIRRSQNRTCWTHPTPTEWIDKFSIDLKKFDNRLFVDNSGLNIKQTYKKYFQEYIKLTNKKQK